MARYLLAFHGGRMEEGDANAEAMAAWDVWFKKLGDHVVDPGNPVGATRVIAADGHVSTNGIPSPLSGYTVIDADSLDAAVQAARECPVLRVGATVEVCETVNVM